MGRSPEQMTQRRRRIAVGALCLAAALAVAVPALASRGATKTGSNPFPPDSKKSASANCPPRTHATGGGFAVTPAATPGGAVESFTTNNNFAGRAAWTVTSGQVASGHGNTLTAAIRCERKRDGKIAILLSGTAHLVPDTTPPFDAVGQNLVFHCPPGTHPIAGGYQVAKPFDPNNTATTNKFFATQTRRTGTTWTVSGYLLGGGGAPPADFTGTVPCEKNGNRPLVEKSKVVPFNEDSRATASATCKKGTHLVSGGFAFTPNSNGPVPVPFVDQSVPTTRRIWTTSAYDSIAFSTPVGSTLTTYAYCRRNLPKPTRAHRTGASSSVAGQGWVEVTPAPPLNVG